MLIKVYRSKSVLWDPKNPQYYNKIKKEDAWEEISEKVKKPKVQCKRKMEYLLAALRREKIKMKRSLDTGKGTDEIYQSQWFAFESLQFLWDRNKSRRTSNTMEDEIQNTTLEAAQDEVIEETEMGEDTEVVKVEQGPSTSTPCLPTKPAAAQWRPINQDERLEKAFQIFMAACDPSADECQHFGNFVAAKLRELNVSERVHIQVQMVQLFAQINKLKCSCNKTNI